MIFTKVVTATTIYLINTRLIQIVCNVNGELNLYKGVKKTKMKVKLLTKLWAGY